MKYINHITLNTGHVRKTYPHEVNKQLFFVLNRLFRDSLSLKEEIEIFDGYTIKITNTSIGYLITVFDPKHFPILTTGISKNDTGELWKALHTSSTTPIVTDINKMPELPYIADRIEFGAVMNLEAMKWTGDFSRCMGWIILNPRKIR